MNAEDCATEAAGVLDPMVVADLSLLARTGSGRGTVISVGRGGVIELDEIRCKLQV